MRILSRSNVSDVLILTALTCFRSMAQHPLRVNEIQVIGSHNSYHAGLAPSQFALLRKSNPQTAESLEYRHPPLDRQLAAGVRQLELDVFADSRGGRYAQPSGLQSIAREGLPPDPPFDPEGVMKRPGLKVMHVQDLDYRSTCQPFTACLTIVRDWSRSHPRHLPIFILIENKDENPHPATLSDAEPFTAGVLDAMDAEIRSVFSKQEMLTPDDVRGGRATLEQAVLNDGWPTLEAARGKVIFLMDQRRMGALYLRNHPGLRGRVLFTNAEPGSPDAAFVEVNDPLKDPALIPELVRKGYLVRTRTDEPTAQARRNDTQEREAALASGAQILSTDYPFEESATWTGYAVRFPEGAIARCNPVLKPLNCRAADVEEDKQ